IPDELAALIHAMLAKDPAARPRSGEPLVAGFERVLDAIAARGEPGDAGTDAPADAPHERLVLGRYRITDGESRIRSLLFARRSERAGPGRAAILGSLRALVASL